MIGLGSTWKRVLDTAITKSESENGRRLPGDFKSQLICIVRVQFRPRRFTSKLERINGLQHHHIYCPQAGSSMNHFWSTGSFEQKIFVNNRAAISIKSSRLTSIHIWIKRLQTHQVLLGHKRPPQPIDPISGFIFH